MVLMLHSIALWYLLCTTVQYNCTILHHSALDDLALHCGLICYTALYSATLHYISLSALQYCALNGLHAPQHCILLLALHPSAIYFLYIAPQCNIIALNCTTVNYICTILHHNALDDLGLQCGPTALCTLRSTLI